MTSGLYVYQLSNIRVIDGDTIDADIDLGFRITVRKRIRLYGIDAPETRLQSKIKNLEDRKNEKSLGLSAKARVSEICSTNSVYLESVSIGKYGRVVGTIYYLEDDIGVQEDFVSINDLLVTEGYASVYKK
jgi:micrococcal nuclease